MKRYNLIYSDPPWNQTKGGTRKARPNQTKNLDYETISLQQIIEYHNSAMGLCEDTHTVFMWTIDKFLHETESFMKNFGYKLHARIIWDKNNGVAPAFTIRYSHEYLLWFYKPKMMEISKEFRGKYTSLLREQATKHSRKPEVAYKFIEDLYPDARKLEMYAREKRSGWDSWGNEIESDLVI